MSSTPTARGPDVYLRRLEESAKFLQLRLGGRPFPETLVVLGSGFRGFEAQVKSVEANVTLAEVPYFPVPAVEGHGGGLVFGTVRDRRVAVMTGRVHLYEGWTPDEVVFPLRAFAAAGVKNVLLTNAAGSVDVSYRPGEVVLVKDHMNLTGRNCLASAESRAMARVFVDMVNAYDPAWRLAIKGKGGVTEGVYAGLLGPTYETPAETAMLGRLGAHVVGMSTVQETIAARHLGLKVCCLSFVSNLAGGLSTSVDHGEVLDLGQKHRARLHELVTQAIEVSPG